MAALTLENLRQDRLVMSVVRVIALANEAARSHGVDPATALISLGEEPSGEAVWRVHYGPRDYINQRGGDLIVWVDERAGEVQRVVRGP